MTPELRRCTHGCAMVHYENCPGCFGFGIYGPQDAPISAAEAMGGTVRPDHRPCPICQSTIAGVPV